MMAVIIWHAKDETSNLIPDDASQHRDPNYKVIFKIDPLAVKREKHLTWYYLTMVMKL